MSQWRLVKQMGITLLDITVKTGCRAFSPRYEDLMQYKNGTMSKEEYTRIYLARMLKSRDLFPDIWSTLKEHSNVALACYCGPNDFCHRHLFKDLMKLYLNEAGITVNIKPEITKDYLTEKPKQLGADIILKLNDSQLVQHYLMASYCYYVLNESPMVDEAYDLVCKLLTEKWDSIEHPHKKYICFADGKVGSAFGEVNTYPNIVKNAAEVYTERIESGDLFRNILLDSEK